MCCLHRSMSLRIQCLYDVQKESLFPTARQILILPLTKTNEYNQILYVNLKYDLAYFRLAYRVHKIVSALKVTKDSWLLYQNNAIFHNDRIAQLVNDTRCQSFNSWFCLVHTSPCRSFSSTSRRLNPAQWKLLQPGELHYCQKSRKVKSFVSQRCYSTLGMKTNKKSDTHIQSRHRVVTILAYCIPPPSA